MFRRRAVRIWALGLAPLAVVLLVVAGLTLRGHVRDTPSADRSRDAPGPVLLVTGYGGGTRALDGLAARLRTAGREAVVVPPTPAATGTNTGDLRQQAGTLDRVARAELAGGAPSVDVVGFSAGGVVARVWASELGGAAVARRVVTLGSPHHGADVAGLVTGLLGGGCPPACEQLAPGSALLRSLPESPGAGWTSIWTADDQTVTPPQTAALTGARNLELQTVCPGAHVGHGDLPADPRVAGLVLQALDAGLPPHVTCPTT